LSILVEELRTQGLSTTDDYDGIVFDNTGSIRKTS